MVSGPYILCEGLDSVEFIASIGFCRHRALIRFLQPVKKCLQFHSLWPVNSVQRSGLCRIHYFHLFLHSQCPHFFLPACGDMSKNQQFLASKLCAKVWAL